MAPRLLENISEASIQTREKIQEEGEAKVGKAEVDESCEDCTIKFYSLWVYQLWHRCVDADLLMQLWRFMACCFWIGIKHRKARSTNLSTV